MANQTPPLQGYMLQLAATRLTPEKLALLKYKLDEAATRSNFIQG